ncbi:MAG: hypothetical protein CVU94_03930 [Firmicutes bacterium HGW-Firmicutes-19]|jgi:hypothetical protein|nr:MAG: hypothetical protein CVU94_03930 [Firmicutes bacterium HGW-Firmicutes-19]
MSEFSRVKKYAQLRDELASDNESEIKSEALAPYADRLSKIDTRYQPMEASKVTHSPLHSRNAAYAPVEEPVTFEESTFNNEYLDQFIEEVKQYNMRKGYRKSEDTKSEVLLKVKEISEPSKNVVEQTVEIDQPQDTEQTISMQVMQLVNEDDDYEEVVPVVDFSEMNNEFLQKTQELNMKLDTYQHELTEVNDRVINTNRLLNFLIALLILGLIVVMGVVIYWILLVRGII